MPTVALSMIVKNGGEDLRHCLASVRGIVDQIVIADTGSTDNSHAIAQEFGATIIDHRWANHYAEARNACLLHITTDWVLVLDSDEELSPEAASEIPKLIACSETTGGFTLHQRNYLKGRFYHSVGSLSREFADDHARAVALGAKSYIDNPLCRLFRKHPQIYFTGRIHEIVEHQFKSLQVTLAESRLIIHHFGHLAEKQAHLEKQTRYRDLLRLALDEAPEDSSLWVQLGVTEKTHFHRNAEALCCYLKATELGYPRSDAWITIAQIYLEKGEPQKVIDAVRHLSDLGDEGILKREFTGDALHNLGRMKEARAAYNSALKMARLNPNYRATGRDAQIESKLGYTEARLGMHRAGIGKMRRAIEACPTVLDQHDRIIKALVLLNRDSEAADAAESVLNHFISERIVSRAVALNLRINRVDRAARALEVGLRFFPESSLLREMQFPITQEASQCLTS